MFCENCGSSLPEGSKFCGGCGAKTEMQPVYAAPQRQSAPPHISTVPPPQTLTAASPAARPQTPPAYTPQAGVEPLSVGQYIVTLLLIFIPIVGLILLFKWSFSGTVNLNKKNMARAYLVFFAVWFVLILVGGGAIMGVLESIMR